MALWALAACGPGTPDEAAGWTWWDTSASDPTDADSTGTDAAVALPIDTSGLSGRLSIATFNVQRFFDTTCDSARCEGGFESVLSDAQFAFRAGQIADAIERLDVDVVLLQEVETQDCVEAVAAALGSSWETLILGETGAPGSLDVAVIARGAELLAVETHRDVALRRPDGSATTFTRELLEVHLGVVGARVIVFAAHFKSKQDDDPGRRLAEAAAARDIVGGTARDFPDALVVLGGDLNDEPGSDTLAALEAGGDLFRVGSVLANGEDGTHRFGGRDIAIDHLYLAVESAGAVDVGTVAVVRDASGGLGGSDHAALRASFAY